MSQGTDFIIGIARQSSGGTAANVNSLDYVEFVSESLGRNIPPLISQGIRNLFDENDEIQGPNTVDGDLTIEARPIELGHMLRTFCNSYAVTAANSGFEHTFDLEQSDWDPTFAKQPVTIHKGMATGSAQTLYDLNANIFEFSLTAGEFLMAKIEFVGGQLSQVAEETPTFESGRRFAWDQSSVSFGGSSAPGQKLTELVISVDEKLEAMHTVRNSTQPSRIHRTDFRSFEISGTMKFDDQAELQDYFNQTEKELLIHLEGENTSGSENDSLTISMPSFKYREYKPEGAGPGKVEVSFTGSAKYNTGSGHSLTFTLVNTHASYA